MVRRSEDLRTPLERAKEIGLRQVASRMRTEAQIRARLAKAELDAEADAVVAWLMRLGYLDDAAYARARARALVAPGKLGPRMAERRLVAAGISPAAAREVVTATLRGDGEGDARSAEVDLCRELALRRARGTPLADLDARARQRLSRFLLGRGFSGSTVARVLGIWQDGEG